MSSEEYQRTILLYRMDNISRKDQNRLWNIALSNPSREKLNDACNILEANGGVYHYTEEEVEAIFEKRKRGLMHRLYAF